MMRDVRLAMSTQPLPVRRSLVTAAALSARVFPASPAARPEASAPVFASPLALNPVAAAQLALSKKASVASTNAAAAVLAASERVATAHHEARERASRSCITGEVDPSFSFPAFLWCLFIFVSPLAGLAMILFAMSASACWVDAEGTGARFACERLHERTYQEGSVSSATPWADVSPPLTPSQLSQAGAALGCLIAAAVSASYMFVCPMTLFPCHQRQCVRLAMELGVVISLVSVACGAAGLSYAHSFIASLPPSVTFSDGTSAQFSAGGDAGGAVGATYAAVGLSSSVVAAIVMVMFMTGFCNC